MAELAVPVIAVSACSGSGKTTLLTRLLPCLRARGLQVAAIKHSHHDIDLDQPGKDSHALRQAGANPVILACPQRTFTVEEHGDACLPTLATLLQRLPGRPDLVLAEGFKHEPVPRLEVWRPERGRAPLWPDDPHVVAVASTVPAPDGATVAWLDLDQPDAIADWLCRFIGHALP